MKKLLKWIYTLFPSPNETPNEQLPPDLDVPENGVTAREFRLGKLGGQVSRAGCTFQT